MGLLLGVVFCTVDSSSRCDVDSLRLDSGPSHVVVSSSGSGANSLFPYSPGFLYFKDFGASVDSSRGSL